MLQSIVPDGGRGAQTFLEISGLDQLPLAIGRQGSDDFGVIQDPGGNERAASALAVGEQGIEVGQSGNGIDQPAAAPGRGCLVTPNGVLVVSLQGRTFMPVQIDDPFLAMDDLLAGLSERPRAVVVDFHAEATSEKGALSWHLDGRVSAVVGTHTHVGTVDARVLPKGTAFVSDLGMCGVIDSIIGDEPGPVLERFLTGRRDAPA